jgi:hypothetical protein
VKYKRIKIFRIIAFALMVAMLCPMLIGVAPTKVNATNMLEPSVEPEVLHNNKTASAT